MLNHEFEKHIVSCLAAVHGEETHSIHIAAIHAAVSAGKLSAMDGFEKAIDVVDDYNAHCKDCLKDFRVWFTVGDRNYSTVVPAYSNGGAENKVLDTLCGKAAGALAGRLDGQNDYMMKAFPDCVDVPFDAVPYLVFLA